MAYIDAYTGMDVLTPEEEEEKRRRQKELADTAVHTEERKVYGDGTQEIITKKEISPEAQGIKAKPSIFENLGNAVAAMPENFVNNLKQAGQNFATNIQNAPDNVARNLQQGVTNLQNAPANVAANVQGAINPNQPQAPQTPQPQFDRNAYNTSIAQQESGNRADIGYHDRTKSTAFGAYGITAPAYQDARRVDPSLPADITQATPEQQTRAHNIITDNNARFLQQKGIEPTPGVLAAAHFTGAGGLHKFLTQKDEQGRPYISPQAQAANGGYDKAAAIINGRLGGQAIPSSGALGRPTAMPGEGVAVATGQGVQGTMSMNQPAVEAAPEAPISPEELARQQQYSLATGQGAPGLKVAGVQAGAPEIDKTQAAINRYQTAQDDPIALIQLRSDTSQPEYLRKRAGDRVAEMITSENNRTTAEQTLPTLSQSDLAKVATKRSEGNSVGDWLQYLLFKHVGLNDLANQKAEQLGIGHAWQNATVVDADGKERAVEVLTTANGRVLQGNYAGTNEKIPKDLLEQAAGGILGKGVHVTKVSSLIDPETKQLVTHQTLSNGQERYTAGGKSYQGDKSKLQDAGEHVKQEDRRVNAARNTLAKDFPNPTQQQVYTALRNAGVPTARIEQELGMAPGSISKAQAVTGAATAAQAGAPAAAPGQVVRTGEQPFDINNPPQAKPGQRADEHKAEVAAWQKKKDRIEKRAEELPKVESNAADSIATVSDLLTHPGFSDVIGVPNVITGIISPPGTDARDFKSKYKQLLGQQFLAGFNSLRGGGSITEVEGQQAKEAVAAMQDPYISEREFKRNAELYMNTLKRAGGTPASRKATNFCCGVGLSVRAARFL